VELIKASSTGEGWPDFVVLLILQFANGMVGYVEETNAGNAIAALKERLAPECHCKRNGQYVVSPCAHAPCPLPAMQIRIAADGNCLLFRAAGAVCRWKKMPSRELVPGDLIELKLGDIVPADAILLEGQPVQVDQAALTGESLPVTIHSGGKVKQGSALKRGEIEAVVCATGAYPSVGSHDVVSR
jgi:H+-transporting ATPase